MKIKNFSIIVRRASELIIIRSPTIFTLTAFPSIAGLFLFTFSVPNAPEGMFWFRMHFIRQEYVAVFANGFMLSLILSLGFFLTFRWNSSIRDRSYGYWLSQGMSRIQYVVYTYLVSLALITFGLFIGMMLLNFPGGSQLRPLQFAQIFFLMLLGSATYLSLALFIAELTKDPETGLLVFVSIGMLLISAQIDPRSPIAMIFDPINYLFAPRPLLPVFLPLIAAIVLFALAVVLHVRRDIGL